MTTRRSSRTCRFIGWVGTRRLVTRLHPVAFRSTDGRGPFGHHDDDARWWAPPKRVPVILLEASA